MYLFIRNTQCLSKGSHQDKFQRDKNIFNSIYPSLERGLDANAAKTIWELQARNCAQTAHRSMQRFKRFNRQVANVHRNKVSYRYILRAALYKDIYICMYMYLYQMTSHKVELDNVSPKIDWNWCEWRKCFEVLTPNALKRFRRGSGSCLLRNTSDLGLGGFLGRMTTCEWYFISSLISSSSSLLSDETDNCRCTRSWWSVLSVLRQSVKPKGEREAKQRSELKLKQKMCSLMSCTSAEED